MNLILRLKKHSFWEKTLTKKRKRKMNDHGKDNHGTTSEGTNQDFYIVVNVLRHNFVKEIVKPLCHIAG